MAEILEIDQMLPQAYEPLRQNKWILEWDGIDQYTVRAFARPNLSFGEVVLEYINTKRYFQGKFEWQTVSLTLIDPIAPSATQKIMEWVRAGYENVTGRTGYKEMYVAKNFKLKMLDGPGAVVQMWEFINPFPTSVDFGTLDYGTPDPAQIVITLRYDSAILKF